MFNLFWRKKYEKNLEAYKEHLINDYKYIDYYKNRIKEIINSTPYYNWDYNLKFNQIKDLEIIFLKDNYTAKVLISSEFLFLNKDCSNIVCDDLKEKELK